MFHLRPGMHQDRSYLDLDPGSAVAFFGRLYHFLFHMHPVMIGPVAGKTFVIGRRFGLFRELFALDHLKKIADQGVYFYAVTWEIQGHTDAAKVSNILLDLFHVLIGNRALDISAQYLTF